MTYQPGTLLSFKWDNDSLGVCKVVKITETRKEPIVSIVTYSNAFESIPEDLDVTQLKPMIIHMPMLLPALTLSECAPIGETEVSADEERACETWSIAWQERRVGFFEKSIDDAVNDIIEAMAEVDSGTQDPVYRDRLAKRWQNKPGL